MEEWHERVFEIMNKDPLPNAMPVTLHQVKEADKALFRKLAEKTRGDLMQKADGTKPMDTHFDACMDHPEVQFCLIPMIRSAKPVSVDTNRSNKSKGKGKGLNLKKDSTKGQVAVSPQLPPDCSQMTPDNKPICNLYNRGKCQYAKDGKRCRRGFHVCWRCFKPRPFQSCDHS